MNDSSQRTLVKFYQVDSASLSNLPIEAGHLIFVTDTKRLYLDRTNSNRIEIASYSLSQDSQDGHTLIFTNTDGTTSTITIPDNDTLYTAGSGIEIDESHNNEISVSDDILFTLFGEGFDTRVDIGNINITNTLQDSNLNMHVKGNLVQNGTPSPTNQASFTAAKNDYAIIITGKNLFNSDDYYNNSIYVDVNEQKVKFAENNSKNSIYVPIAANTTYTVSHTEGTTFGVASVAGDPSTIDDENPSMNASSAYLNLSGDPITITTGTTDKYLVVWFWDDEVEGQVYEDYFEILDKLLVQAGQDCTGWEKGQGYQVAQINVGSTELYKVGWEYDEFIKTSGKNILSPDTNDWESGGYSYETGEKVENDNRMRTKTFIPVKGGAKYYYTSSVYYDHSFWYGYNKNGQFVDAFGVIRSGNGKYIPDEVAFITVEVDHPYSTYDAATANLCVIREENYYPNFYEPYGSETWYFKQNVKKIVLDGTEENWAIYEDRENTFYLPIADAKRGSISGDAIYAVSDYYPTISMYSTDWNAADYGINARQSASNYYEGAIYIKNKDISTVENLKIWLATHNTTVYYALDTSICLNIQSNENLVNALDTLLYAKAYSTETNVYQIQTNPQNAAMLNLDATFYKNSIHGLVNSVQDEISKINYIPKYEKGIGGGIAELDVSGRVPTSQLPSYVDDVIEYSTRSAFPATGESGKIYIALDTNITYRWSGSTYVMIASDLALGETSSTAYRGDRGAAAYTHAVINKGSQFASGFYKITTNEEGHVTAASNVVKSDITNLGIPGSDTTYAALTETEIDNITNVIITNLDEVSF